VPPKLAWTLSWDGVYWLRPLRKGLLTILRASVVMVLSSRVPAAEPQ
jgi:hypothetical protein